MPRAQCKLFTRIASFSARQGWAIILNAPPTKQQDCELRLKPKTGIKLSRRTCIINSVHKFKKSGKVYEIIKFILWHASLFQQLTNVALNKL